MVQDIFSSSKSSHDFFTGKKLSNRKPFKISTKKIEWMLAACRNPYGKFIKTSKCRNRKCKRQLKWSDRTYEFDHKDNNPRNNNQKNCYLVCKICHSKATVVSKRKIKDKFTGYTIGHKTIKKKVGYKKTKTKPKKKRKSTRRQSAIDFFRI